MQRRKFIQNSALMAVAVSASGFIRFDGRQYIGDCETTSDILGPFYRPDSPVRTNLLIAGEAGRKLELTGTVLHKDCISPYKNAKVELWHCDAKGVYDNSTDAYRYRGTTYTDESGNYSFRTILPVPYDVGNGNIRPAHFHMMITATGYQPLVTQLYFAGDAHIATDAYASTKQAKSRILDISNADKDNLKVIYNVGMADMLAAEPAALDQLTGIYTSKKDSAKKLEFFKKNDLLWMKNDVFAEGFFVFTGNNRFEYPSLPPGEYATLQFRILEGGGVEVKYDYADGGVKFSDDFVKQ